MAGEQTTRHFHMKVTDDELERIGRLQERLQARIEARAGVSARVSQRTVILEALEALEEKLSDLERKR